MALFVGFGRIYIRFRKQQQVQIDDGLHLFAIVTLIAGTALTYVDIPYIYLQESVESGSRAPPPNLIQQLLKSVKIQDAGVVLLCTTLLMVKMSFLFFFRNLLRRLKKMMIWWWCVVVFTIPSTIVLICSDFIACSYFDERILGEFLVELLKCNCFANNFANKLSALLRALYQERMRRSSQ